jgi:hypothetical protein
MLEGQGRFFYLAMLGRKWKAAAQIFIYKQTFLYVFIMLMWPKTLFHIAVLEFFVWAIIFSYLKKKEKKSAELFTT